MSDCEASYYSPAYPAYSRSSPVYSPSTLAPGDIFPTKTKRSVDRMNSEELAEYEKQVLGKIKKRKLALEKTTIPKCSKCCNESSNTVIATCGHLFCTECYCKMLVENSGNTHHCPNCDDIWCSSEGLVFTYKKLSITKYRELGADV
jgi:hypothetical protein